MTGKSTFGIEETEIKKEGMVGLEGFEPPTHGLGNRCSILLSYRPMAQRVLSPCNSCKAYHCEAVPVHASRRMELEDNAAAGVVSCELERGCGPAGGFCPEGTEIQGEV